MKQRLLSLLAAGLMLSCALSLPVCAGEEKELQEVTLNEVAHSIFYAPQYAAIELGYLEEEGIELTLITGFGVI